MTSLNLYGDSYLATSGTHGADIASQRCDELDRASIDFATERDNPSILDVGCGRGAQSIRFAQSGANVVAVDIVDATESLNKDIEKLSLPTDSIKFVHSGIEPFLEQCTEKFDVIYSQRFIHYLKPAKARAVVAKFYDILTSGGAVFVSASGMSSELSEGYPAADQNVAERFDRLSKHMQEKHGIKEPVCLYYPNELTELFSRAGFEAKEVWESSFGNVKAIFIKP